MGPLYDGSQLKDNNMITINGQEYNSQEEFIEVMSDSCGLVERSKRKQLLTECDWVVVKAQEEGVSVPSEWVTYRTALRDMPTSAGWPLTHTWPTKP